MQTRKRDQTSGVRGMLSRENVKLSLLKWFLNASKTAISNTNL